MTRQSSTTTADGTRLLSSPTLKRAQEILQQQIIAACERSTKRPGNSVSLVRFQFAYDENSDGKFCTHYDALVRDHHRHVDIPLTVTIAVNDPLENWT